MCPVGLVSEEARAVHVITNEELAAAPRWPEVYAQLVPLLEGHELVTWNASFDRRVLRRSSSLYGLAFLHLTWHCAMDVDAQISGEHSEDHGDFRWVNLEERLAAHCFVDSPFRGASPA